MKNRFFHWFVIGIFTLLYFGVSIMSTIHVVTFFEMTNTFAMSVFLAVCFELGAAASLASIAILEKANKPLVWTLFIVLTLFQAMGNMYATYIYAHDFTGWVELFNLMDFTEIAQKRILSILSGALLPLIALGYIKSLVDYIHPDKKKSTVQKDDFFNDVFEEKKTELVTSEDTTKDLETLEKKLEEPIIVESEKKKVELEPVDIEKIEIPLKEIDTSEPKIEINKKVETVSQVVNIKEPIKDVAKKLYKFAGIDYLKKKKAPQGDEFEKN